MRPQRVHAAAAKRQRTAIRRRSARRAGGASIRAHVKAGPQSFLVESRAAPPDLWRQWVGTEGEGWANVRQAACNDNGEALTEQTNQGGAPPSAAAGGNKQTNAQPASAVRLQRRGTRNTHARAHAQSNIRAPCRVR